MKKTCENCRFWEPLSGMASRGICRKEPPNVRHGFPTVQKDDWCGQF